MLCALREWRLFGHFCNEKSVLRKSVWHLVKIALQKSCTMENLKAFRRHRECLINLSKTCTAIRRCASEPIKKLATRREKVANSPFEMEEERRCWNVAIRLKVLHQKTFLAVSNGIYNQEILKTVWAPFSNPIRDWIFSSSNNRWWIPKNSEPFRLSYLSFSELKQNSPLRSIRNHSMNIKVTATEMHQTNPWVFPFEAVEDGDSPANANVDHSESIRNALLSRHWPTATGSVHCSADGVSMLLANALFG